MSTDNSRSRMIVGSGSTISASTRMTTPGTSSCDGPNGLALDITRSSSSQDQLLEADQVRQHFGHSLEQVAGDELAHLDLPVDGPRQRRVLDDRHAMLAGNRP